MAGIPFARKKSAADMTRGSIALHLISFAFPLLLGNIFQQLYNTVDTWVVGNFASNEAFSAVGSVGPIINVQIGLFMGLSTGAGAVISQFYGARHLDRVRDTVHTAILMTAILSVVFTLVGLLFTPAMLRLTPTCGSTLPVSPVFFSIIWVQPFSGLWVTPHGLSTSWW